MRRVSKRLDWRAALRGWSVWSCVRGVLSPGVEGVEGLSRVCRGSVEGVSRVKCRVLDFGQGCPHKK